ncbi:hypothetical protein QVD17_40606 [Tagetes erecta]|uniref:Uncharacterized protein n=1 Tax=Tagetes erecta TaxID=13708 RepID=A0AAD8JS97_TARER|nr:hypothetical protein QVD17_40606 [Tagetes erecta]
MVEMGTLYRTRIPLTTGISILLLIETRDTSSIAKLRWIHEFKSFKGVRPSNQISNKLQLIPSTFVLIQSLIIHLVLIEQILSD